MDEDEELWFNDDDCEEEPGESVSSGSGEPDKDMVVTGNGCEKIGAEKIESSPADNGVSSVPPLDKVMEEDKKKEAPKKGAKGPEELPVEEEEEVHPYEAGGTYLRVQLTLSRPLNPRPPTPPPQIGRAHV